MIRLFQGTEHSYISRYWHWYNVINLAWLCIASCLVSFVSKEIVFISCRESFYFLPREFLLSREEIKKVALYNGYKATLFILPGCSV